MPDIFLIEAQRGSAFPSVLGRKTEGGVSRLLCNAAVVGSGLGDFFYVYLKTGRLL